MNQQKCIFLVLAFIGLCLSMHAETLYYTHKGLHLKFAIDTETKEAMLGNGIDSEKNAIARPPLTDPWWNENPQTNYWKDIDVPSTIICEGTAYTRDGGTKSISRETYTVTSVAPSAFYKVTEVQTIKLPETIREIGSYAFAWCIYLRSVILPEQLSTIKGSCFWYCKALKSIHLPDNIRSISGQAFCDCENLEEINIPGNCVSIGNDAFTWCPKLHKVTIENGTESLSVGYSYQLGLNDGRLNPKASKRALFADCHIDTLYLGRNIICSRTNDNKPLSPFESTLNYSSYGSYYYNSTASYKKLEFGETVTEIADSLFYNVDLDFDIIFPQNLKRIGKDAFYWNVSRYFNPRRIEIPASVEYIGENAFRDNYIGELIFHEDGGGSLTIGKNAFRENELTSVSIPGTVTNIQDYAFYQNKIVNLELADGIQEIGYSAFGNNAIKSLTVPASVTSMGSGFSSSLINVYCNPLTPPNASNPFAEATIYVPAGKGIVYRNQWGTSPRIIDSEDEILTINVKTAGTLYSRILAQDIQLSDIYRLKLKGTLNDDDYSTISNISRLYDFDMSELNITGLPSGFFNNNTQLINIVLPNTLQEIEDNAFVGCSRLSGTITIPENCTSIGTRAFYGLNFSKLICKGVVNIHEEAFMNCSYLKEVQLAQGITVDINAFSSTAIEELYIPANVTIGDHAFNTATLNNITFDGGGQEIGNNVFEDTVERYTFNGSVKTIGTFAQQVNEVFVDNIYTWCAMPFTNPVKIGNLFINNEEANNIVIPNDVKTLRNYLFYDCPTIQTVQLSDDITEIPDRAFKGCVNLSAITFSTNLEVIGDSAFAKCVNLREITLPSKVETIGYHSFAGCIKLETINLSPAIKTIGDGSFLDCSLLDNVILPESLLSIGGSVFSGCSTLKELDLPQSITSIGAYAFSNCRSLVLVVTHWKEPITVTNISGDCLLYVPIGTSQKYVNAGWNFSNMKERGTMTVLALGNGNVEYDSETVINSKRHFYFKPYNSLTVKLIPNTGFKIMKATINGNSIIPDIVNGELFIDEPEDDFELYVIFDDATIEMGDVNADRVINSSDAKGIANYILKRAPEQFKDYWADVNGDGVIDITDIIVVVSKYMPAQ